jgi:hypothetical protein
MQTATETRVFNYALFRKRVMLFDSDSDGERNLAFTQALRQCAERSPPLKFHEAAAHAFGSDDAELAAAHDRVSELESEIARLEQDAERLANGLTEQREINAVLQDRAARLQAELRNRHDVPNKDDADTRFVEQWKRNGAALKWLLRKLWPPVNWTWPNILTLALGADIAITWFWLNMLGPDSDAPLPLLLLVAFRIALFVAWGVAIFRRDGRDMLLVKSAVWMLGWWLVVLLATCVETGDLGFNVPAINKRDILAMFAPTLWWHPLRATDNAFLFLLTALLGLFAVVRLSLSDFGNAFLLLLKRLREK